MKGIFIIGQDKSEARLLKDIALTLHSEFDSIEIRYSGTYREIDKDSFLLGSKKEIDTVISRSKVKPIGFEIIPKEKLDIDKLKIKIRKANHFLTQTSLS